MANRVVSIIRTIAPAVFAGAFVLFLTLGTLFAVALRADVASGLSASDWAAISFTIRQAVVSAVLSVAFAIPVARALARRQFWGRGALITLLGAPFLLPVIVAVFGLLMIFGREGLLNDALDLLGLPSVSIYGFSGVVLAHVFFNMPLATRLILQGWQFIPAERFRMAASLDLPIGRFLERPMLWRVAPSACLVIFLICLTSFAVALTLGGGPRATTVELAIYQALRFDFDLSRAAMLGCVQFGLCVIAALLAYRLTEVSGFGPGLDRVVQRWDARRSLWIDASVLLIATLFLVLPLGAIVVRGLGGLALLDATIMRAAFFSIVVALLSTAICILLALVLASRRSVLSHFIGVLPLTASSLVVGTGLFLMVFPFVAPRDVALLVTVCVNAILALPFALRALQPALEDVAGDYGRVADSLNMTGLSRFRLLTLPRIKKPLGFSAGLAAALSTGDLGVIALFADERMATLPLAMYRLMGSYQMDAAAGAGLLLLALSLLLFWLFDRGGRSSADL